jgi:hypothetical protein
MYMPSGVGGRAERRRDGVAAVRVRPGEEEAAVEDRQLRGDDDVGRPDDASPDHDPAGLPVLHVVDATLLEDVAPVAGNGRRQSEQVAPRVELRLVLEPERGADRKREQGLVDEPRRQARLALDFRLLAKLRDLVLGFGVDVVRAPRELAPNPIRLDEPPDPLECSLVRLGIDAGAVPPERRTAAVIPVIPAPMTATSTSTPSLTAG